MGSFGIPVAKGTLRCSANQYTLVASSAPTVLCRVLLGDKGRQWSDCGLRIRIEEEGAAVALVCIVILYTMRSRLDQTVGDAFEAETVVDVTPCSHADLLLLWLRLGLWRIRDQPVYHQWLGEQWFDVALAQVELFQEDSKLLVAHSICCPNILAADWLEIGEGGRAWPEVGSEMVSLIDASIHSEPKIIGLLEIGTDLGVQCLFE